MLKKLHLSEIEPATDENSLQSLQLIDKSQQKVITKNKNVLCLCFSFCQDAAARQVIAAKQVVTA